MCESCETWVEDYKVRTARASLLAALFRAQCRGSRRITIQRSILEAARLDAD